MSVAEFAIGMPIAMICIAGVHELFRIQSAENAINVVASAQAAELSYQSLRNILDETFAAADNPNQRALEEKISSLVGDTFQSPLLLWRFSAGDLQKPTVSGIKVTVSGASFSNRFAKTEVKIQVCLKSWLEPLLRVLSDGRNCLGQYKTAGEANSGRGIPLTGLAIRASSVSLIPYFSASKADR
ncbi:MAG: hypothetical protein RI953_883 [Pseudomonadota bacterium]